MLRDENFRKVLRRDVDQISLPAEEDWLPRSSRTTASWSNLAVAAGLAAMAILLALALTAANQGAGPASSLRSATPSREPSDLAVLPEEQAVLDAFNRAGIGVRLIGASKFEAELGPRLPARVFIVVAGSDGADILFLPAAGIGDIRVCTVPAVSGSVTSTVFVGGRQVSSGESRRPVYYLLNSEYFVVTYDPATRDALSHGLGLTAAQC